ncbi:MAG: hypothetical protein WC596_03585 [Candidatus Shapirobacteria bacterium]
MRIIGFYQTIFLALISATMGATTSQGVSGIGGEGWFIEMVSPTSVL